jgi:hypothetical protein
LAAGADPNIPNEQGTTPLFGATDRRNRLQTDFDFNANNRMSV